MSRGKGKYTIISSYIRIILILLWLWGISTETGPWTTMAFVLMFIGLECGLHESRKKEKSRMFVDKYLKHVADIIKEKRGRGERGSNAKR